jgi:hypothetical protein
MLVGIIGFYDKIHDKKSQQNIIVYNLEVPKSNGFLGQNRYAKEIKISFFIMHPIDLQSYMDIIWSV